tara:strand:+ start:2448 stop:3209 length:762 start_codon:yes stop_codon:yes gene_type:complete
MKYFFLIILILFSFSLYGRGVGETEITSEEGIEVFQNEKYYLLKKNVKINSDSFTLLGDEIKIFFDKDLYDVKKIDASKSVNLISNIHNIKAVGENLIFTIDTEEIFIKGINSKLQTADVEMYSNGQIKVNNLNGNFLIIGPDSNMKAQNIYIEGEYIEGIFNNNENLREIIFLKVIDENLAYIRTENTDMYSNIVNFNKSNSLIELENNVQIIRDGEKITGDYGTLNTETNSYKVKSKNSNKVKVIISNKDE